MSRIAIAALTLAVAANLTPTSSRSAEQEPIGQMVYRSCQAPERTPASLFCQAYFSGFVQGAMLANYAKQNDQLTLCLPDHLTPLEAIEAFIRVGKSLTISERQQAFNAPNFGMTALYFLQRAYPCR